MTFRNKSISMKLLSKLCFLFITIITFTAVSVYGQSSGNLQGKITDANSGDPLPGANVFLEGTAIGTATDLEGEYKLKNLPAKELEITISYIGYEKKKVKVTILPNKTTVLDVSLKWNSVTAFEDIVVTGQLEGQAQAINQQISSDQIVNIVSEQKIKELPDANAAESVGRLPGVAIQRDGGEASKLMIRGLDPKFTNVTVNGIQVPATDGENRSVDLSIISQSTLTGIELYKALTPDQDADAIAGVVNLVTGQAKPKQKISLDVYGIYSGLNKQGNQYKLNGSYSNRFFDNFLGVQVGLNVEKRDRNREYYNNSWDITSKSNGTFDYEISALTVEYDEETRKRYGGNINLDINTSDGGNIKFINLYSKTSREQLISNRNYPTGGSVTYRGRAIDRDIFTFNNSLIGENHFNALKIDWALSHAYTENEKPFDHSMRFTESKSSTSGMKNITEPWVLKQTGQYLIPYAWNNFESAAADRFYFYRDANDERNFDVKIDFEYPIRITDAFAGIVKAGYKFRGKTRHRTSFEQSTLYYLNGFYNYEYNDEGNVVPKDWASSSWPDGYHSLMTDYLVGGPNYPTRTINNDYFLNPLLDENLVREWYAFNKSGTDEAGTKKEYFEELEDIRNKYMVKENVHGTYAMVKLNAGQLVTLIAGVRYEYEDNKYQAMFAPVIVGDFQAQTAIGLKDTVSNFNKEYWLPNVHLKVKPYEWLDLRFAATKSISRPDFAMRLPQLYINNQDQAITSGNPNLESAVSWNYDASISLYASKYGLLTVSGYRKNIDNVFYWLNNIKIMSSDQARELNLPVDKYGPFNQYEADIPVNTNGTKVWGFEIDLQTHLSFLPGALQNIVVSANLSKIWSKTKYPRFRIETTSTFPPRSFVSYYQTEAELSGQTDYTANIVVGYDYMGFSGRISGYFQGKYLASISNLESQDVYQKPFSRWDIALKQMVLENVSVFLNINNFTNVIEGSESLFGTLDNGGYLFGIIAEFGVQLTL